MNSRGQNRPYVAIACGGTGGHLFPGLAVAEQLLQGGSDVALLISRKEVDQQAVKSERERRAAAGPGPAAPFDIHTLPAVGLQNRNYFSFASSFMKSLFSARKIFWRGGRRLCWRWGALRACRPFSWPKSWAENLSARVQHHSRPGQSLCWRGLWTKRL